MPFMALKEKLTMSQERIGLDGEFDENTLRTPFLVRATLILIALNLIVAAWFFISPNTVNYPGDVKAATAGEEIAQSKSSPFEPAPQAEKRRKAAKLPVKIEPVIAQVIPEETYPSAVRLN